MPPPPHDRSSFADEPARRVDTSVVTVGIALVVLLGVAASSLAELRRATEESEWVAHTREVLDTIGEATVRSAELGRPADPLEDTKLAELAALASRLRQLTDDNPAQRAELARLEATIAELRAAPSPRGAGSIRPILDTMRTEERALLADRKARALRSNERARWLVLAGNVVAFALVGYAVWRTRREAAARADAQAHAEARRREAEERKREAEELYNGAPCGYHVSRAPDLVYDRVNDTELAWLGYTREELVGKRRFSDFLTEESRSLLAGLSGSEGAPSAPVSVDLELVRRDGSRLAVTAAQAPARDAQGNVTAVRTTLLDVDVQRRAQVENERLRAELEARAASLETVNRDLEAFSYSISHDLRAPLRAIGGFARILEEDHAEVLGAEGRRVLGVVRTNTSRMSQLVDDLLAFSRLGRRPVARANVDMKRLAEDVVEEMKNQRGSLGADVSIGELPPAHADPGLVRQVLVNLVSNAVKYSAGKPAPTVTVTATAEGGEPVYHVKDNGAGFDMQGYDKLFGVFQRLHRHEEFPGTGVGLAIAHRVVAKHGGKIWAASKVGEGAEFHFTLPKEPS